MKKAVVFMLALGVLLVLGCGQSPSETASAPDEVVVEEAVAVEPVAEARHDLVYICGCGPDCTCGSVAAEPGTCSCGKELVQAHLLKVEGNEGILCTCGNDCTCTLDPNDATKCGCGKDVKRVSFEGKGLYYCNCGGSCSCNYVSSKPGTCSCGMELTTS